MWDVLQLETFCWNATDRRLAITRLSVYFWFIIAPGFHQPALGQGSCIGRFFGLPFFPRKHLFAKQQKELNIFCRINAIRCNVKLFLVSKSKWQLKRNNKETFHVLFCQFFFFVSGILSFLFRKVSHETQPENLNLLFVAMNFSLHERLFPGFGFHFEKGMVLPYN